MKRIMYVVMVLALGVFINACASVPKEKVLATYPVGTKQPKWVSDVRASWNEKGTYYFKATVNKMNMLETATRASDADATRNLTLSLKQIALGKVQRILEEESVNNGDAQLKNSVKEKFNVVIGAITLNGVNIVNRYAVRYEDAVDGKAYFRSSSLVQVSESDYNRMMKAAIAETENSAQDAEELKVMKAVEVELLKN